MNFLKSTPITAESLTKRTNDILGIFTKTINDLHQVVASAKNQIAVKEEGIAAAQAERNSLQVLVDNNEQVITKLEGFVH